ncbi:MAG TPA: DEAD/DEAH box helicase [Bdellovibrionota bacterium]|nr:DEAD/DEAH box helicase [Bdellovibrionota bacterium]
MTESELTSAPASAAQTEPTERPGWDKLGLSAESLELIRKAGFTSPTPVQAESIPVALTGQDVIASAQTGTGKTASFVLPMVERFKGRQGTFGLILSPTREIAQQTQATLELFGTPCGVRSIVLIGGINMRLDTIALDTYPQIIVATPGRLCDHLDRGNIWLDYIEMVVLDEADRMLDMGFSDQLNRIMEDVPSSRQTLLYSATIPPSVDSLARKILRNPARVAIGKPLSAAKTVEQSVLYMKEEAKNRELLRMIRKEPGSIIVFTRSKDGATRVWRSLHSAGVYDATYIHSDRLQAHREQALAEFKEGKYRILIATDVAGRGIHVDGVAHVINYDLPLEPEDYVHRIGRTGRAEATGKATSFITPRDRRLLQAIEKLLGRKIEGLNEAPVAGEGDRDQDRGGGRGGRGGRGDRDRGSRGGRGREPQRSEPRAASPAPQRSDGRAISPAQKPVQKSAPRGPKPGGANPAPVRAADFAYPDEPGGAKRGGDSDDRADFDDRESNEEVAPGSAAGEVAGAPDGPRKRRRRRRRGGGGRSGGGQPEGAGKPEEK